MALVYWIPFATTVVALVFATIVLRRYAQRRSGPHLLWWAASPLLH